VSSAGPVTHPDPTTHDLETRADIHDLVVAFYREIVFDDLLAPVFGEVAEVDWALHIPKLIDYWCRVLLGQPGYAGAILNAHRHVHDIEPFRVEHFDRWYALWIDSIDQRWTGPNATMAKVHAAQIAAVLARRLLDLDWQPPSAPGRPEPHGSRSADRAGEPAELPL
jgi:hemoglobin